MPKLGTEFRGVGYVGLGKALTGTPGIGIQGWSRSNRLAYREYGFTYGPAYCQTVSTGETMLPPW